MSMYAVLGVFRGIPSIPSIPSSLDLAGTDFEAELDPELLALPNPPRQKRLVTLLVLASAALAALSMVFALRYDIAFALTGASETNVGDLRTANAEVLALHENRLVRAEGMLGAVGGIRYERRFAKNTFRAVPIAGRRDVWVELRVPSEQESGRWEPPLAFSGRLVRFDATGPQHDGLAAAIESTTREHVPGGAWLLIDGEAPAHERWVLIAAATFLGFAAWHLVVIARMLRKFPVNGPLRPA